MNCVSNVAFNEWGKCKTPVKDTVDVITDYATQKQYGFAKAICVLGVDVPRAIGIMSDDNCTASVVKDHLSLFKLSCSPAMFLDSVNTTVRSAWSYLTNNPVKTGRDKKATVKPLSRVVRDAAGAVNPVAQMATFLTKAILFIPKASIQTLKGVNGIALTFLMGWSAFETLQSIGKERIYEKYTDEVILERKEFEYAQGLMNLIKEVSYVGLGVLTTLIVFASVSVAPVVLTALSASGVVFTILPYYHKNIGQEKKIT